MSLNPLEIDGRSVQSRIAVGEELFLLDCRERGEHAFVRLPQAQLLPMSELHERVEELEPYRQQEIVVFCHHGFRSQQVALWLRQLGFERAMSLAGGIDRWAVEIDPALPRY